MLSGSMTFPKVSSPYIHHRLSNLREGPCESYKLQEIPGCVDFLSLRHLPPSSRRDCFSSEEITTQYLIPIFLYVLVDSVPIEGGVSRCMETFFGKIMVLLADTIIFSFHSMLCLENSPRISEKSMF